MIDITKLSEDAEKEFTEERAKKAKDLIKAKMHDIARAEAVVGNLKRELEDLYADIGRRSL